jgi:hypothetical protein
MDLQLMYNKTKLSKREYVPPCLSKYDSLTKITLGTHAPRGQCSNFGFPSNVSCIVSGIGGYYKGGPNNDCCDP